METKVETFIIKIWLEETTEETDYSHWRDHITHVPSGKRKYFEDLKFIETYIQFCIERMTST